MDNLTHTLVGVALAESGLRRRTALATATLVIGANLPDVDALSYLFGSDVDALAFRRGWTHGILAMVVLPLVLAGIMVLWHRWRGDRDDGPPFDARWILILAVIGIWSHPLLDLLNNYGVRLLMPFSDRWFYGDTIFIVDPWILVTLIAGILWSRHRRRHALPDEWRPARTAAVAVVAYVAVMLGLSRIGHAVVVRSMAGRPAGRVMVAPTPANPLRWEVIRDLGSRYERGVVSFAPMPSYHATEVVTVGAVPALVAVVRASDDGSRFLQWSRFPVFELEGSGAERSVLIGDFRYSENPGGGWASATIPMTASRTP